VEGSVTALQQSVDTLNGDSTIEGSVDFKVSVEEARAKSVSGTLTNLTTTNKTNLVGAINEVNAKADGNTTNITVVQQSVTDVTVRIDNVEQQIQSIGGGNIPDLTARVETLEGDVYDTTDDNDNLIKGLKSRVTDVENVAAANAQGVVEAKQMATDAMAEAQSAGLATGVIDGHQAFLAFRDAFLA
jgi:hypothetical protein